MICLLKTDDKSVFILAAVVGIGSSITMPMVRAIMSRISPAHKQGRYT